MPCQAANYTLEGHVLETVFEEKDLGVLIDSDLSFEDHITEKVKKAYSMLGLIRRNFTFLDKDSLLILTPVHVIFTRGFLQRPAHTEGFGSRRAQGPSALTISNHITAVPHWDWLNYMCITQIPPHSIYFQCTYQHI